MDEIFRACRCKEKLPNCRMCFYYFQQFDWITIASFLTAEIHKKLKTTLFFTCSQKMITIMILLDSMNMVNHAKGINDKTIQNNKTVIKFAYYQQFWGANLISFKDKLL